MAPSQPEGKLACFGDVDAHRRIAVEGILRAGEKAHGRIVVDVMDCRSWVEVVAGFERVTGRKV